MKFLTQLPAALAVAVISMAPGAGFAAGDAIEQLAQAEGALLGALRLGSDSFAEFRDLPSHVVMTKHHFTVAEQVQQALHDDRIVLAYQPIVDATTSDVVFYEGLARLLDEDGALVP